MDRLTRIIDRARASGDGAPPPARRTLPKVDPGAIADAMIARRRMAAAARRACTEDAAPMEWDAEMREGETLVEAMIRVIAEKAPPPLAVVHPINLMRLREQFCALPVDEREDEIARHRWSRAEAGRTRTHFSPLLDAMGVA